MKREFPSTPEEAFETSNEGAYYSKQITKARIKGRIRKVYYDANVPVHTAWDLGYKIQRQFGSFSSVVRRFIFSIIMRTVVKL